MTPKSDDDVRSNLKKVTEFLGSDTVSKSLTSLLDTWKTKGRSKDDVEKLLSDLDSADKDRKQKLNKIKDKIVADQSRIQENDDLLQESIEAEARLQEQIACLDVRLAERSRARAELDEKGQARRKRIDEILTELDIN